MFSVLKTLASSFTFKRLFPSRTKNFQSPATSSPEQATTTRTELLSSSIGVGHRRAPAMELNLNPFKFCSGLKYLGYVMILLVIAIVGLSYYAVVVLAWGPELVHGHLKALLAFFIIIIFHLLLVLLTWSYFMVVFEDPGSVPENWRAVSEENVEEGVSSVSQSELEGPESSSNSVVAALNGTETRPVVQQYCSRCQNGKPPRCHHCSVCQRCVLKMDHHCVWVVNCVGARNYKFFLLFVFYAFLETTLDALVLLPHVIESFGEAKDRSGSPGSIAVGLLAFVLNVAFALSLLCFLGMHASLLSTNTTTIEVYEKKKAARWKYDLGRKRNFVQVFGTKKLLWFFPMYSKDDLDNIPALRGVHFPLREDVEQ